MWILSIDESGRFEKQFDNEKETKLFVGGILINEEDSTKEEVILKRFLENTAKDAEEFLKSKYPNENIDIKYPKSFHMGNLDIGGDKSVPSYVKNEFKDFVYSKVINLLKDKRYKLVYYLKDMKELKGLSGSQCNLLNDNRGGNLYERMVLQLVYNTIFYNLDTNGSNNVVLNFATRKSAINKNDEKAIREIKKLGAKSAGSQEEINLYEFSNTIGYRSAIATKLLENNIESNIDFSFNSYSINYKKLGENPESLYLADIICGYFRKKVDENKGDYNINKVMEDIKNETGQYPKIYIEDSEGIDKDHNRLIEAIKDKNFIKALEYSYEIEHSKSKYSNYYTRYMIEPLKERIDKLFNDSKIPNYICELETFLSKSESKYELALYILRCFKDIISSNTQKISMINKYKFADFFIRALNHKGYVIEDLQEYLEIFNKCKEYITIEEYIETKNRIATTYSNSLRYNDAIEILEEPIELASFLKDYKNDIASMIGCKSKLQLMGKLYSSKAQFLAFLNRNEEANNEFEKAFKEFGEKNETTKSYLLHNLICLGSKEEFKKELLIKDKNQYIKKIEESEDRHELFFLIKGIYKLFLNEFNLKDVEKIKRKVDVLFKKKEHPWELIYRNLGLIFYELKKTESFIECMEIAINISSDNYIGTLKLIQYLNKSTLLIKLKNSENYLKDIKILRKNFVKNFIYDSNVFKTIFEDIDKINDEEFEDYLLEKLTYMYN